MLFGYVLATVTPVLLLSSACGSTEPPSTSAPLELDTCTPAESPTELLRLEGTSAGRPVDVFDLGSALSVRYALQSESDPSSFRYPEAFSVVDNCGGEPVRLRAETFGFPTGAGNVGGEVVACAGEEGESDLRLYTLLADGSLDEDIGLPQGCDRSSDARNPSLGIVFDTEGVPTQYLPDGSSRVLSTGAGFELVETPDGAAAFVFGAQAMIQPADGSGPIELDLPEPVFAVYPTPGGAAASGWVIAMPRSQGDRLEPPIAGYAVELSTGAWFETPEVQLEVPSMATAFSVREGLMATSGGSGTSDMVISRAGWGRHASLTASHRTFAVLDAQRLFVMSPEELRILQIPLELPEGEDRIEPEVLWARALEPDDGTPVGAGFVWNELVMARQSSGGELRAYPIDGQPSFSFVPNSPYLHVGPQTITGLGPRPDDEGVLYLFQRRFDGDFEIIADDLDSGIGSFGIDHAWTPGLGRILYSVRDGDAISVRQHRLVE